MEGLDRLKASIIGAFRATKPGFQTSMVESFFSTQAAFWQKGHRYTYEEFEMRCIFQALQWNRVENWQLKIWDLVKGVLAK